MHRLSEKVAIITGGGRGLGKAISELFAAEGAQVAVVSRSPDTVESTVAGILAAGGEAAGFVCDVSEREALDETVRGVVERFGGVDILVNNAHDTVGLTNKVMDISVEQLDRQFSSGPFAALQLMQACQPHMRKRGWGRVINIASGAGVSGAPTYGAYAMAKEALRALTRCAAREWGKHGITVNNVCPLGMTDALELSIERGFDATPTTPIPRYGSPTEDIAPTVLFLASDDGQYLTGYTLMADGGMHIDTAR
jgi:NAD(P)-dependent dehydrogenase (short-subunit alcohol dehydrogenase family)